MFFLKRLLNKWWSNIRILLLLLILLNSNLAFGQATSVKSNNDGDRIFDEVKNIIFQIKTSLSADSPKASYGSGFVIDKKNGLIITNYHVVASSLQDKKNINNVYLVDGNSNEQAQIINFSIVHDLALLKVNKKFLYEISINENDLGPKKGERIFSLGVPKDLNLSLVEGTYNGTLNYGIYEENHMSTAINSGMSGGPTLNTFGKLIGVNVSIMLNSQNISFSVPVKYVRELLLEKEKTKLSYDYVQKKITLQLDEVQDSLMHELKMDKKQKIDNWSFYQLPSNLKCWSENQDSPKFTYKLNKYDCSLNSSSFIKDDIYSGTYDVHFFSITNKTRNAFQFYSLLNYYFNDPYFENYGNTDNDENFYTTKSCDQKIIFFNESIPWKINYCLQGYTNYADIYDAIFKAVTLTKNGEALIVKWRMKGFKFHNIKKITDFFLSPVTLD